MSLRPDDAIPLLGTGKVDLAAVKRMAREKQRRQNAYGFSTRSVGMYWK